MTTGNFDVPKALAELEEKSLETIEAETAFVWGSRALAALQNYQATGDVRWLIYATTFANEAVEHAASASPGVFEIVKRAMTLGV